jgi:hypothetical protein
LYALTFNRDHEIAITKFHGTGQLLWDWARSQAATTSQLGTGRPITDAPNRASTTSKGSATTSPSSQAVFLSAMVRFATATPEGV